MANAKFVLIRALVSGTHNVVGAGGRQVVVTNANKKADADYVKENPGKNRSAYEQRVERVIAEQLVERGVAKIVGKAEAEPQDDRTAAAAARRVEKNLEDDAKVEGVSGAATRDTTAHARDPLSVPPTGTETSATADAPPTDEGELDGDSAPPSPPAATPQKKAPLPKKVRKPRKARQAKATES